VSVLSLRQAQRRGAVALAGREVRRVVSLWTQTILPPVVTAMLFLAVFGGALGARIREIEGLDYLDFILPGLLVMTVASQSIANASTSVFQAKNEGYIDDVLTSPLRPWQLVTAYMAGAIVRALAAALVIAVVAMPFAGSVDRPLAAAAAVALTTLVFSALGTIVGVWANTFDQQSFVTAVVVTPLALVGGVFYAAGTLDEPWVDADPARPHLVPRRCDPLRLHRLPREAGRRLARGRRSHLRGRIRGSGRDCPQWLAIESPR
jgi:ABC-2 type transport system permease protein